MNVSSQLLAGFSVVIVLLLVLGEFSLRAVNEENAHVALERKSVQAPRIGDAAAVKVGENSLASVESVGADSWETF